MFLCLVLFSSVIALPDATHLPDVYRQSVLCAKRIVAQYFEDQYPTAITYPRETYKNKYTRNLKIPSDRDILISDTIIKELTYELFRDAVVWYVENDSEFLGSHTELPMHFIVILSHYDGDFLLIMHEFCNMISLFMHINNFGNRTKLIIIFPAINGVYKQKILNTLFELFSKRKIYNIVVIYPTYQYFYKYAESRNASRDMIELYTWFPYQNHHQCGKFQEITLVDRWIHEGNGKFEFENNLFSRKVPTDFTECTMKITQGGPPTSTMGLSCRIFKLMLESITHSVVFNYSDPKLSDAILVGKLYALIYSNKSEDSYTRKLKKYFIFSEPYIYSQLNWYVSCDVTNVIDGQFHKVFYSSVWIVFFTTCILSAAVTVLIQRSVEGDSGYYWNFSYSCYIIWAVVTSVSVPVMPRTAKLRIFFFMWTCYCLIISTVFQSFFTSYLTEPGVEKGISSAEELLSKNLSLYLDVEAMLVTLSEEEISLTKTELEKEIKLFTESAAPFTDFIENKNSALLTTDVIMKLKLPKNATNLKPCYFNHPFQTISLIAFLTTSNYYDISNAKMLSFQ